MHASTVTKALIAAVANAIAHTQSLAAAGPLTLTASPVVLDTQRRVIITSAGDDSGLTWTVIGTNDDGSAIKDQFAGANGVATSNLNFKTVVSISGSAATASTVTSGTNTVGSTPWKLFADTIATAQLEIYVQLVSGAGNVTFEYTNDPFLAAAGPTSAIALGPATLNPLAISHPVLQSLTASMEGFVGYPIHAWRLTVNSGTGSWKCTARQAGLASP